MYADPEACPDCRRPISPGATACPHCSLSLTGPAAQQLFATLQQADLLVAELRAASAPAGAPPPPATPPVGTPVPGPRTAGLPAYPTASPPPRRRFLNLDTVPAILVGVGALCLLIAALVFLAVAWSVMGVGGRTVTLVVLTAAFGAVALLLTRKGLRAGAEALWAVTLGLVALDVVGMEYAGWLGDPSDGWLVAGIGGVLAAAGLAVGVLGRSSPVRRLALPEAVGALGLIVAGAGMAEAWAADVGDLVVAAVVTLAVAALAQLLGLRVALPVLLVGAAGWWLLLVAGGLEDAGHRPDLAHVWGDGEVWPLLVAIAIAAAVAAYPRAHRWLRVGAAAAAGLVALAVLAIPLVDGPFHWVMLTAAAAALVLAMAVVNLPSPWRLAPVAPLVPALITLALGSLYQAGVTVGRVWSDEPWTAPLGDLLRSPDPEFSPLVVVPAVLAVLAAAHALTRLARVALPGGESVWAAVTLLGLAGVVTLANHDVPRWLVPAALLALVVVLAEQAALRACTSHVRPAAAGIVALLAVATALPSDVLTAVALAVLIPVLVAVDLRSRGPVGDTAAAGWVLAVAGLIWSAGHALELERPHVAVAAVAVLGLLALGRSLAAYEIAAWVAIAVSILTVADLGTWLTVVLTLAGALAAATALVREDRREMGWVGAVLLTAATWVRLADLGEETPEWYTLPLATGLIAYGVVRMLRDPRVGSLRALSAGLGLAVTPSLLITMVEPVSLRALLLGIGCAVLVIAGFALRWEAPLIVGATAGVLLVLRQAIAAEVLQQWYTIGLIGALILVVGVTWEARLRQLRAAYAFVREMR